MHPNTKKLRTLMKQHKKNAAEIAVILDREVNTVRIWRMKETPRVIPSETLQLLDLLLNAQAVKNHSGRAA